MEVHEAASLWAAAEVGDGYVAERVVERGLGLDEKLSQATAGLEGADFGLCDAVEDAVAAFQALDDELDPDIVGGHGQFDAAGPAGVGSDEAFAGEVLDDLDEMIFGDVEGLGDFLGAGFAGGEAEEHQGS
jgi:hypothetical protein